MGRLVHVLHIHPALVHLPIALFLCAFGFEVASRVLQKQNWHRTALHLYILAAVLSPVVVQAGLWEQAYLHLHHPLVETHKVFGLITMWTALTSLPVLWFVQKKNPQLFRKVFIIFTLFIAMTVSTAAYYGGRMVYDYGVGIDEQ